MTNSNSSHDTSEENTAGLDWLNTSRRRFIQATGGTGIAGLLGVSDTVAAQDNGNPPEPTDDILSVMFIGGPEGGSHNAPDRLIQISEYLQNRGIEVYYTDRQDDLLADTLHRYDAWILMDNRSGLTQAQEDSLITFVQQEGGGFVGIHSASACFTESDRFIEHIGGQFQSHEYGEVTSNREVPDHPIFTGFDPIVTEDETYVHTNLNPDNNVIATATGSDFAAGTTPQPWTWVREEGDGRIFYTAFGHGSGPWAEPGFKKMIENAIRWTSGNEGTIGADTRTLEPLQFTDANVPFFPGGDTQQTVPPEVGSGTNWSKMQMPLSPQGTSDRTITPEGFDIQYFVTEDTLPDNMSGNILDMAFDESGRCYLALSEDYPNNPGGDNDSIVVAEDTDGDGQADEFTVFADGLSIPSALTYANGGIIVCNLGQSEDVGSIVFIEDTDGDLQADSTTELFSGFGNGDTHAGVNELSVGIDNWIWGQVGYSGFSGTIGGEQFDFSSSIYRFKPDGSEFQIMGSLPGNQAGVGFDEEGLAFASAATAGQPSNYLAIPGPYYQYVNGLSSSGRTVTISDANRFIHATDRIRQVDFHGGYTAATGQSFYTARSYPQKYWNNTAFVGDGTGGMIGAFWREPDGASFIAHNANNIATSTDAWFSPTYSQVGPDGNVWAIDLYEYIFQHNPTPEGFENGEGNAYETELRETKLSRLLRLKYGEENAQQLNLGGARTSELVDALSHDNMFWRQQAQRLLVERGNIDIVSDLASVVQNDSPDQLGIAKGAVHALWTLHGLGALEEGANSEALSTATGALGNASAAVRLTALRVLPGTESVRDAILSNNLVTDDNMRVRMWTLLALARMPSSDAAGQDIFDLMNIESNFDDEVLREAALIGGATHAEGFIAAYEEAYGTPSSGVNVFEGNNGSFEEVTATGPASWSTTTYTGESTATFTWVDGTVNSGSRSLKISSSEGADASWNQTISVEPNTEYTFTAYIKTENLQTGSESDVENSPYGATISIEPISNANYPDIDQSVIGAPRLTGTNDWTEVSTTFNSGENTELTPLMLFGGYGTATGTAWYDVVSLTDPNGNNVLSNGGAENGTTEPSPVGWSTTNFSNTEDAQFALDTSTAQFGSNSTRISAETGLDGAWHTMVSIEDNNEYELVGWIETENVQTQSSNARGALFNVHSSSVETEIVTGTNEWAEVSTTFNSGDLPDNAWSDGRGSSIRINALFGGSGTATGTARYDGVALWDPDADSEPPNVAENPGFEEVTDGSPDNWTTFVYGGDGQFTLDDSVARNGSNSTRIEASSGSDASWSQIHEVQPNTQYQFSAYVKTGENFALGDGSSGSPFGATLNIHQLGQEALAEGVTEAGQDWTLVETTFNSGDNTELRFNLLYGGFGNATGQVWWDDVTIQSLGDIGEGIEGLYDRIQRHLELETGPTASFSVSSTSVPVGTEVSFDASGSSTSDGLITSYEWEFGDGSTATGQTVSHTYDSMGDYTVTLAVTDDGGTTATDTMIIAVGDGDGTDVIAPGTTITFDGYTGGWEATAPSAISGQTNPTLTLQKGAQYTLQFTNQDGAPHDIAVQDSGGNILKDSGEYVIKVEATDSIDITASTDMTTYVCTAHPTTMIGDISVQESGGGEGPPPIGDSDSSPTDPDGDSLYEDINGDGEVTDADGEMFFEHFEDPEIQNYPEAFDFNGNGRLDLDDIVAWRNKREN